MKLSLLLMIVAALTLSACASSPPANPTLMQARTAITEAARTPAVAKYAPISLKKARKALDNATSATSDDDTDYWAYIALRRAQMAKAKASEGLANKTLSQSQDTRQQILANARKHQLRSQKAQIAELNAQLSKLNPHKTDKGIVLTLGGVLFALDSSKLRPGAATTLNHLADFLKDHPQDRVKIIGYTDSTGSSAYNMKLSKQRAMSVKSALIHRGVPAASMTTIGRGENNPVATNQTRAGRQRNRRVEFIILTGQQQRGGSNAAVGGR